MYDLVIRNGEIADGTGAPLFAGDIAINGDRIAAVGPNVARGREEIDANGMLVTPGFVDIHTHYDGQATWDPILAPTAWHGVTSIIMGNCGVGFAPAQKNQHEWLIKLMAGVEDIPVPALTAGLKWNWETYPEYMDVLASCAHTMDIGTQIAHGAVRVFAMGERGSSNETATSEEIHRMSALVEEGVRAGALGFSTSRVSSHKSLDNVVVPGTYADRAEIMGIAAGLSRGGPAVFEWASDLNPAAPEFELMTAVSVEHKLPISFVLIQSPVNEESWTRQLERGELARKAGANLTAQISIRGIGYLLGWRCSVHPFFTRDAWKSIANKPWAEQLAALKDPEFRKKLLAEPDRRPTIDKGPISDLVIKGWHQQYWFESIPDYEPGKDKSIATLAAARGIKPEELAYDLMMEAEGSGLIYLPVVNYMDGNLDHVYRLLNTPWTMTSLSDGGAHCGAMCDAGSPTFLLSYWARDRKGPKLSVEGAVKRQTMDAANLYGLYDRGIIGPGYLADLNIIDFDKLALTRPYMGFDLPTGARRLLQKAEGYVRTIKRGVTTFQDGVHAGRFPGQLIRGAQSKPV